MEMFGPGFSGENPFYINKGCQDVVVPLDMMDYKIGGVPLTWLNVNSKDEAIEWYENNCYYLPDEMIERMAVQDYKKKKKWEKKMNPKKTKKQKMIEEIKRKQREAGINI